MTTTIRARAPRELLAYVPFRLGYRPRDSVALVALRAPRGRVGLVARVDLADLGDLEHGPQVARALVSHVCADGADRAVVVVYADVDLRVGGPASARARAAVEHWTEAAADLLGEPETWVVTTTGYYGADCRDPRCCPPEGRPLADLDATEVGAHMVLAGATVAPTRDRATALPTTASTARRSAARAAARSRARHEAALAARDARALAAWRRAALDAWHEAMRRRLPNADLPDVVGDAGPDTRQAGWDSRQARPDSEQAGALPAALLGRLDAALECAQVRDAILLSCVAGDDELAVRTLAAAPSRDVEAAIAATLATVVDPRAALPPDPARAGAARDVLEAVASAGRRERQAPALTLLALLAWWDGDGILAADRLRAALACDADHRLALLLDRALTAGLAPGWARASARDAR
ncbi:DUF4192 family protein [Oerskovia turbata]